MTSGPEFVKEARGGRPNLDQPFATFCIHLGGATGSRGASSPGWPKDLGPKLIRES